MKLLRSAYWIMRIALMAFRWAGQIHPGDAVIYCGERWIVVDGSTLNRWLLTNEERTTSALRINVRKVRTLKNCCGSVRAGYRFYMGYWHSIWARHWRREK